MEKPPTSGGQKVAEYVKRIQDGESREEILKDLPPSFQVAIEAGLSEKDPTQDLFSTFGLKHGETRTVEGIYWYEYTNKQAEELKKSKELKWGEERLYFDVPLSELILMRDAVMKVAATAKVPVAFKFLDQKNTFPVYQDGSETRFVANFASPEDAQRFYLALCVSPEYQAIVPDRSLDYKGLRIDEKTEYASGFREKRAALERIMQAVKTPDGRYQYMGESGKARSISADEYANFRKQYENLTQKMNESREGWERALKGA